MSRKIDWIPLVLLVATPVAAIVLIPIYFMYFQISWPIIGLTFFWWLASGMSITGGYHRMFSHRAYDGSKFLKAFYLFFGAAAFQNTCLIWSVNHRQHHRKVDTDEDPYSINKGAFFAHMGWMIFENPATKFDEVPKDLQDPMVQFQHDHYLPIALFAAFGLPTILGYLMGDMFGGFLFAGLTRLVVLHHSTFFVNSLAHMWGSQPYTDTNTAKDNFVVALLTYGEGYHNFHHYFEADYRNGIRWYQFDPTKWFINSMAWLGQATNLRRVPAEKITMAKMNMQKKSLAAKGIDTKQLEQLKEKFVAAQTRWKQLKSDYDHMKHDLQDRSRVQLEHILLEMRLLKIEIDATLAQWRECIAALHLQTA